jgi:putative CocE/NonD family hydrolase
MVPMRDGVKLKTDIYFPPNWDYSPRGVVLSRTPYNAEAKNIVQGYAGTYTQKGYIVVLQDQRGCFKSEGIFPVFNSDNTDGVDTINWIMDQSWCNGAIATIGGSAVCTNQYYYHAENPTGLKAANLLMGAPELYDIWFYPGGCYKNNIASWWLPAVTNTEQINLLLSHPSKDDYWINTSLITNNRIHNINLRAVHIGGWYDVFAQGTITGFEYYNYHGTEYAKNHQILVMGPWGHGPNPVHPDITYPDTEGWQFAQKAEEFIFGEALDGLERNWSSQPRVYYYMMGDPDAPGSTQTFNHWRTANDWPLSTMNYQPWYLHPNGTFSPNIPTSSANHSYLYDPTNPVGSRGGTTLFIDRENTACDQRPVETNRTDIQSYITPILTSPIEIAGRINATLLISSNCTDTDFMVKLMDVFPDGREMWVASGILKTRYRNGFSPTIVANMTPGEKFELNIDMWSTAYHFSPGHQIKISITSSNYPAFAVNPNTGGPVLPTFSEYNIANNTIICGNNASLSALWLPIIPIN